MAANQRIESRDRSAWDRPRSSARGWLSGRLAWIAALLVLVASLALIVAELMHNNGVADSTTLVLFALAMILIFAVVAPEPTTGALRRITSFKFGAVEFGLGEIKLAERLRPPPDEHDGVGIGGRPAGVGYKQIVGRLEICMDRTRTMLELHADGDNHREIADRLRWLGLLSQDEEAFVLDLLRGDPLSADWPDSTQKDFLDSAWSFATRFRAMIWDRHVRKELEKQDWFIAKYDQALGHRPDYLVHRENRWALVAARPGTVPPADPDDFEKAVQRLSAWEPISIAARCIVMPDKSRGELAPSTQSATKKVMLCDLAELTTPGGWPPILDRDPDAAGRSVAP